MPKFLLIVLLMLSSCSRYEVSNEMSYGAVGQPVADPLGRIATYETDPSLITSSLTQAPATFLNSISGSWVGPCKIDQREVVKVTISGTHLTRKYYGFLDDACTVGNMTVTSTGQMLDVPDFWQDYEITSASLSNGTYVLSLKNVSEYLLNDDVISGIFDGTHITELEPYLDRSPNSTAIMTLTRQSTL